MLTLKTVIMLDEKINGVVKLIEDLRSENALLKGKIDGYREKISKLEELISTYQEDQDKIESGIHSVVKTLDQMLVVTAKSQLSSDKASKENSEEETSPSDESQKKLLNELVGSEESTSQTPQTDNSNQLEEGDSPTQIGELIQDQYLNEDEEEIENLDIF